MIMKGTVVIISSVHWHFPWHRHHDIAVGLAEKGYQVIFVEPFPKRWPYASELGRIWGRLIGVSRIAGTCLQDEVPGVVLRSPRILPDVGRLAQWINRRLLLPGILNRLTSNDWPRPLIVLNYLPIPASLYFQRGLAPDLAIYDCVWDWSNDPYSHNMPLVEDELLQEVDLVFADSPYLVSKMEARHPRVVQILPAVHYELFEISRQPIEVAGGRRPLCAYFGNLGVNIDIDLLREVSHRYPLRLIGPSRGKLSGFSADTEFLGPVPHGRVPELLRDADVLLLPYRRAAHTPAVIPAKTFECLATGKPTVVIGLPSLQQYRDMFYICETHDEFIQTIAQVMQENPSLRERRLQCAKDNDWLRRISQLEDNMIALLREKSG
jgi:glycosyltransferase involved in cell wall biosynthesis